MTCGIYMIQNTINGKIYIGQSIDIELRFKSHKNKLERGNHDNIHLQKSWRKYGKEKFEFDILCECEEEKLNETEEYYIFELMTYNDKVGYNKQYGGQSNRPTKETKEKLSKSHKGKNIGKNNNMFGKHHSDESKKKMSESKKGKYSGDKNPMYGKRGKNNPNYGKKRTKESRIKMSIAQHGENHPMYGKHISEEHKLRLKEANSGKNNPKSKRVHCIELNEFFESIGEASRKFNIHPSGISMCCTGKRKTANGCHWEYID